MKTPVELFGLVIPGVRRNGVRIGRLNSAGATSLESGDASAMAGPGMGDQTQMIALTPPRDRRTAVHVRCDVVLKAAMKYHHVAQKFVLRDNH